MKDISSIERLTPEELERIASDASVRVPAELKASLEALAGAAELAEETEEASAAGAGVAADSPAPAWVSGQKSPEMTATPDREQGLRAKKAFFDGMFLRRPLFWASAVAAALVAGVILFTAVPRQPQDTFSDPYLAYAEVQKTFDQISRRGEEAASIAGNAVPVFEKTEDLINRIMK